VGEKDDVLELLQMRSGVRLHQINVREDGSERLVFREHELTRGSSEPSNEITDDDPSFLQVIVHKLYRFDACELCGRIACRERVEEYRVVHGRGIEFVQKVLPSA